MNSQTLIARHQNFSENYNSAVLSMVPKSRTVIIACVDARVDPAHLLGLELGDAVVIRNSGGRVTRDVIEELATLAFMVAKMEGDQTGTFEVIIMHHTQCGAEQFANPQLRGALKQQLGIDVAHRAITDHDQAMAEDIQALRDARELPSYIKVSGYIYKIQDGSLREFLGITPLR